jgi:protein NrfC
MCEFCTKHGEGKGGGASSSTPHLDDSKCREAGATAAGRLVSRRGVLAILGGALAGGEWIAAGAPLVVPASKGYLLVDPKKCQGCQSCMAACSLVHHGSVNLSLARIQVVHDHLATFPGDAVVAQCRQCAEPACLNACPTGALHADRRSGNVRTVDPEKCTGCRKCIEACPYQPARPVWNHEAGRAQTCDLCVDTPFWKNSGGKKACLEVCPVRAIAFTEKMPVQAGDQGYLVNLRGKDWEVFGFTTE